MAGAWNGKVRGSKKRAWMRATAVAWSRSTLAILATEIDVLLGDPTKARTKLGWQHELSFEELVREMVGTDLAMVKLESERRSRHE